MASTTTITIISAMKIVAAQSFNSLQFHSLSRLHHPYNLFLTPTPSPLPLCFRTRSPIRSQQAHISNPLTKTTQDDTSDDSYEDDDGIPIEFVKTLVKFKSRYNYIRVLQVSRKADHELAGSRLLLLDAPGNIHSISYLFRLLTDTYFDVFATIPPVIPPGPLGILGFGAGSAARILLKMYPELVIHGWELDPAVISVGREYFGLEKLEQEYKDRLFIYIGNALNANVREGFAGILVDLYSKGCLIPELQVPETWEKLKQRLRKGGRIMVNAGGSCVEPEDIRKDGKFIMEKTFEAMHKVFPGEILVLSLGNRREDSSLALTGEFPKLDQWKKSLPKPLKFYADKWKPYRDLELLNL